MRTVAQSAFRKENGVVLYYKKQQKDVYKRQIYIYAEACNELGEDIDEAYKLVNTVRERSFMKPMPPEVKTNQQLKMCIRDRC